MSTKNDKPSPAKRELPHAGRNVSLSWTDIFKGVETSEINDSSIILEKAPAGISTEHNFASEPSDRARSVLSVDTVPKASKGKERSTEQSPTRATSPKVDTWRERSPSSKRKEWEIQKPSRKASEAVATSPPKSIAQRPVPIFKDQASGLSASPSEALSDSSTKIKTSNASATFVTDKDLGRPPSPNMLKRTEILPKVDSWRGDRSPTLRRHKQEQERTADVAPTEEELGTSIGIQACSLDFLVSVGAEVKTETPASPTPKKIVMPKVDTRWKDGVPKRQPEFVVGQKSIQVDTDTFTSPVADLKFLYTLRDRKAPEMMMITSDEQPQSPKASYNPHVDVSASTYVFKLKNINREAGEKSEKHFLVPLSISQTRSRLADSINGLRPASPVLRKRELDSAIVTTPLQKEASVAEVDQYLASSPVAGPKQSAQAQRIKAAALTAGKHIAEYESFIRECEVAADEKASLTITKRSTFPIQISLPRSLSTVMYSPKVPMVILLVYVLIVLQLLTGDSTMQRRQNCHQVEFRYSNSGAVTCEN